MRILHLDGGNCIDFFFEVVWSSDKIKEETIGLLELTGARLSEHSQLHVADEVAEHADTEPWEANDHVDVGRFRPVESVDLKGNNHSEAPVVDGVLEDVPHWHRQVAKLVNKDGFQLTLGEEDGPQEQSNFLSVVEEVEVAVSHQQGDQRVQQPRSEVFDDENSAESNLWAEILEKETRALFCNAVLAQLPGVIVERDVLLIVNGEALTSGIELGFLLGKGLLEVGNGGVVVELNCANGGACATGNINPHVQEFKRRTVWCAVTERKQPNL